MQDAPVVRLQEGELVVSTLRWGLLPRWAKDQKFAAHCINARSETVAEKASFRAAFKSRRCVVPADGYFEWQKVGTKKLPWRFVRNDGAVLLIAGLWEQWPTPTAQASDGVLETFCLLTCSPNELAASIHDRMPVLLTEPQAEIWLETSTTATQLQGLCAPAQQALRKYRVSSVVNCVRNDSPDCIKEVFD
jgi:putative SOS response-associated peptidase YedK